MRIIDVDPPSYRSEPIWRESDPVIIDMPPSLGISLGPEWEEALGTLGLVDEANNDL
ncbi:hypothetical protein ACIBBE_24695 [Streptomyces sp. NPDC051644]|uniref:hypothetical protein n=1 Tax=Streptomyces sp. NPDC051644 TaxID=3365666 RepID=UPI00379D0D04